MNLERNSKILSNWHLCGSICGSVTLKNLRKPAVVSLFLLTSPRCLPHFLSLSSVRQLSYWHSHHLLRTRWISLLQKSFALCHSQGCSQLPGYFPFCPLSSIFPSHACFCLRSPHLWILCVFNQPLHSVINLSPSLSIQFI